MIDMSKVLASLPKESTGRGRRSILRTRSDVGEIVVDCALKRRQFLDIAKRLGVDLTTLERFRKTFVTDHVIKTVLALDGDSANHALDAKINSAQDDVQKGLHGIINEQKEIYSLIKAKLKGADGKGRDIEDLVPALAQLLRDQGQSYERLLKSYTALKDKTTITLSINESPDWQKLQEVLFLVFEQHPGAFAMFQQLVLKRRLRLE